MPVYPLSTSGAKRAFFRSTALTLSRKPSGVRSLNLSRFASTTSAFLPSAADSHCVRE
jgi:hypothetical protein